ncbi:MAG TPA: lipocalin family protein [Verrucomicrobiae bacterium]|jgi:hypothetical protein|nr:lipocalin family protein [Verrucomicrobiae bacterium]
MRNQFIILAFVAAVLAGCASSSTTSAVTPPTAIVGTWQWVRVDRHKVTEPFFVRYYTNGTAATWPAPAGWSTTTNGVSQGRYHLDGDFLIIETGEGTNDPKSRIEMKGDELILVTTGDESDVGHRLIYRRVVPDLQPGKSLPGQVSHGAPEF